MRSVNETIAADPRVRHVLLAIADGMTIARKVAG
jgi:predicted O-methyltransferase YrrM